MMFEKLESLAADKKTHQNKYYKRVAKEKMKETSCELEVNDTTNKLFDESEGSNKLIFGEVYCC